MTSCQKQSTCCLSELAVKSILGNKLWIYIKKDKYVRGKKLSSRKIIEKILRKHCLTSR